MNRLTGGPALVLYLAAAKLLFHLFTANRYGILAHYKAVELVVG
jgi:hypothetical protein